MDRMRDLLAQRGVEWALASGKWNKKWDDDRMSPGNLRFKFGKLELNFSCDVIEIVFMVL